MAKTIFQMQQAANIWPIVEKWAVGHNYKLRAPGASPRLYTRVNPDTHSKINLAIAQLGAHVEMQAWYSDAVRDELEMDAPSLYAALPRQEALAEIQELLTALDYRPPTPKKTPHKQNRAFKLGRSIRKLAGKK